MSSLEEPTAGSSEVPELRTSSRTRNKSQRAIEREETNRILAKLKAQLHAKNEEEQETRKAVEVAALNDTPEDAVAVKRALTRKGKGKATPKKKKQEEVYCLCRKRGTGSMIQCEACEDWFHYSCVGLQRRTADKVETYICPPCEEKTGRQIIMEGWITLAQFKATANIGQSSKSPTSPGQESDDTNVKTPPPTPPHSDSEDSASDAAISIPSPASSTAHSPRTKRRRLSLSPKLVERKHTERKPSVSKRSTKKKLEALAPARQYVMDKMVDVVRKVFKGIKDEEAKEMAGEIEMGIFRGFRDVVNGKEVPGVRYKAQFNLLNSSLSKPIRPSLLSKITSREIGPSDIASLTSADLATEERLEELKKAEEASLASTVKSKEDFSAVRFGRDGFEAVVDRGEEEMRLIREVEERNRLREEKKDERRESIVSDQKVEIDSPVVPNSPIDLPAEETADEVLATFVPKTRRPSEMSLSPVIKQGLDLKSAWGDEGTTEVVGESYDGDQTLDFSDIIADEGVEFDDFIRQDEPEKVKEKTEMEVYEDRPVLWNGGIVNPAEASSSTPPISLRLISGRISQPPPSAYWTFLLPKPMITITGRVPTKRSLQYLSDSRLTPGKELVTVAFGLDKKASIEERRVWEAMVQYFIDKDRHAIFLPYDNRPPPNAAKELYLIPIRPSDPSPEFTDLIDNYSLPSERTESIFLGVFITNKDKENASESPITHVVPEVRPPPVPAVSYQPPPVPAASYNPPPASALPSTDQLQALLASVGPIPPPVTHNYPPSAYPTYQSPPTSYPPPPTNYPPPQNYQRAGYSGSPLRPQEHRPGGTPPQHQRQGSWGESHYGKERSRSPERYGRGEGGRGRGRGEAERNRERDHGWSNRGRGRF